MQPQQNTKANPSGKGSNESKPLSETISNAHSSGDGSIQLSEDGLVEPSGETIADAAANKDLETKEDAY